MQIINILERICDCVQIPYFILMIFLIVVIGIRHTKTNILILIVGGLMILWRLFFIITSSRYCISIIAYLIILSAAVAKNIKWKTVFIFGFVALCILFSFNVIKTRSSFRNNYIFDIADLVKAYRPAYDETRIFTRFQEFERLNALSNRRGNNKFFFLVSSTYSLTELINKYSLSGIDVLIIERNIDWKNSIVLHNQDFRAISKHYSGFSKKKWTSVLRLIPQTIQPFNTSVLKEDNNIIKNGNIEMTLSPASKNKMMKNWLDQGASFYSSNDVRLPEFKELIQGWKTINAFNYPKVYVDADNVINGKYSLHIILPPKNISNIYFSNKVPTVPGKFSFLVRPINKRNIIEVSRYDFMPGKYGVTPPLSSYIFNIPADKDNVYRIEIPLDEKTIKGIESLFYLFGTNVNIIVDDIEFQPI